MSLEIGSTTLSGLKHAGSLSDGELKSLVSCVVQTATTGATEGGSQKGGVAYKEAFAASITLLFEAARHEASNAEITSADTFTNTLLLRV